MKHAFNFEAIQKTKKSPKDDSKLHQIHYKFWNKIEFLNLFWYSERWSPLLLLQ